MDLIRRYFAQIKAQLVGLTISQRLLIGLLAVVMVATIFFTVAWSAKPQMVPLIPQAMSAEDINRVEMALKGRYEYQVSGDKVLVPTAQAYEIRGVLMAEQALPKDLSSAFVDFVKNQSPFTTEAQNTRAWNNALQTELTRWLRAIPYVEDGSVIISIGQQSGLGKQGIPSTAAVYVKTRQQEELSQNQVVAIVEMISGGVSSIKRENVSVVVNGQRAYHAPSTDAPISSDLISFKKTIEDYLTGQLLKIFSTYGDVKIAVNVVPDLSTKQIEDLRYDPKNAAKIETSHMEQETSSQNGGGAAGGEPGTKTNTEITATDNGSATKTANGSTGSQLRTESKGELGHTLEKRTLLAGGEYKELSASLMMPRSYFAALFKRQNPTVKDDPEDAKLQPVIDQQMKQVVALAKTAIGAKADDQIQVSWYDDTIVPKIPDVALASSGGLLAGGPNGMMPLIAQYAKQGVLALVALGALGMMMRMVKRAVPAGGDDEIDTAAFFGGSGSGGGGGGGKKKKGSGGVEQLDAADDVFGEANQGEAVLTGIELDDETLASRKMVDEVSTMIKENPENAAALVKRWMTKSK